MEKLGEIVIKERCGISGIAFFKKGIPFSENELKSTESVVLKDESGNIIICQNRVLQTFKGGSIRWLAIAFELLLETGEEKKLFIYKSPDRDAFTHYLAKETEHGIVLQNEWLYLRLEEGHIGSLTYQNMNIFRENSMLPVIWCRGGEVPFVPRTVRFLENGAVYAQVLVEGRFEGMDLYGEWIITFFKEKKVIYQEVKYNVIGDIQLEGVGIKIQHDCKFAEEVVSDTGDWMVVRESGMRLLFFSKDVQRFRGSVSGSTGFIRERQQIVFAPIHYHVPFIWPDGITRTIRMELEFSDGEDIENELKRSLEWGIHTPRAALCPQRYIAAGWLDTFCKSEVIGRTLKLVTSLYGKCWNSIEAGKMPHVYNVNYETETIENVNWKNMSRSSGELDYNLWIGFMNSGNAVLEDLLREHAEYWTDIMFYRGMYSFLQGEIRYQSGASWKDGADFRVSSPFYSDLSGLYLDYMMTGDALLGERLKLGLYHMLEGIEKNGYPLCSYWLPGMVQFQESQEFQIRFVAIVRCMYLAYELYHDERFFNAAKTTIDYVAGLQHEDGLFFEAYDRCTGQPMAYYTDAFGRLDSQKTAYTDKIYIMLFATRALLEFYHMSRYSPALDICKRLGDYLLRQMQDDGWYFCPNTTDHFWEIENGRGCCGVTVVCALNFFSSMFEATDEHKYLLAMLKTCRFYLSAWGGKAGDNMLPVGPAAFLRFAPRIVKQLRRNRERVISLGFYDLVSVFEDETRVVKVPDSYDTRGGNLAYNLFDTPNNRVFYLCCDTGGLSSSHICTERVYELDGIINEEGRLWIGETNIVNGSRVSLKRSLQRVDLMYLMETDLYLEGNSDNSIVNLFRITHEEIVFYIKGHGKVQLVIRDGIFPIQDRVVNVISYQKTEKFSVAEGKIVIPLKLTGEIQYFKICYMQ